MGGDVWAEFAGAEGVAYLTGVFGFLAEEGNLTVGEFKGINVNENDS